MLRARRIAISGLTKAAETAWSTSGTFASAGVTWRFILSAGTRASERAVLGPNGIELPGKVELMLDLREAYASAIRGDEDLRRRRFGV